ncbi:hypothetical protein COOONC_12842, partial [Cooperia oncophora]
MLLPMIYRSVLRYLTATDLLRPICAPSNFVRLRALSARATSDAPPTEAADDEEQTTDGEIDYEDQLKALMPSERVWSAAPFKHHKKLKEVIKELEIFAYMGNFVPKHLTDDDWYRILNTTDSVADRVSFLEYVAVKQRREERDKLRKSSKAEEYAAKLDEERAKFERGEMGYGPDLYQLIHNPMRNRKSEDQLEEVHRFFNSNYVLLAEINMAQGARIVSTLRCDEAPKIVFDLQYMFNEKPRVQSELGNQLQYVISENLDSRTPLHMTFANFPDTYEAQEWLNRHARDMIDGPLDVGAIALCVSKDTAREALGAARRGRMRAVRLPIKKYVKWQKGPMYLPFPNILRIFREVHLSGGDWENALLNNISKRHLLSPEGRPG